MRLLPADRCDETTRLSKSPQLQSAARGVHVPPSPFNRAGMLWQSDISRHGMPLQEETTSSITTSWGQAPSRMHQWCYAAKTPRIACSNQVHGRTQARPCMAKSASLLALQSLNLQRSRAAPGRLYVGRPPLICIYIALVSACEALAMRKPTLTEVSCRCMNSNLKR